MEGANVCPVMVGACVVGALVGEEKVGLGVGRAEGLFVGLAVTGFATGKV